MKPDAAGSETYYRWVDGEGRIHVVSSLDAVPVSARGEVETLALDPETSRRQNSEGYPAPSDTPSLTLDYLSFGLGFAAALLLTLLFRMLPSSMRWVSRLALIGGAAILLLGAYFGWVRRSTGAGSGALASPTAFIQDAKNAVEQLNQRQKAQEEELRRIQAEGK